MLRSRFQLRALAISHGKYLLLWSSGTKRGREDSHRDTPALVGIRSDARTYPLAKPRALLIRISLLVSDKARLCGWRLELAEVHVKEASLAQAAWRETRSEVKRQRSRCKA